MHKYEGFFITVEPYLEQQILKYLVYFNRRLGGLI